MNSAAHLWVVTESNRKTQNITIENSHRFGISSKRLRFDEIADACVKEGGGIVYYIVVKLKTGKMVSLFTDYFDGSSVNRQWRPAVSVSCNMLMEQVNQSFHRSCA